MRLRYSATAAGLAASALVLAACGGDDDSEYGGDQAPGALSFYTDKAAWEPQFLQVSDVSEQSLGFSLDFTGYSDADQYTAFIKQSFRTDEKPDLFTWHTGNQLEELVSEGVVADTTDIWQEAIDEGNVSEDLRDSFTVDDEQYCVPMNSAYWVMYYNKKIFNQHNISVPSTWDELMAAADKLVGEGQTPFFETNILFSFAWFQTLLAGSDPDLYEDLSEGEASYTDDGVVDVMNQWREMHESDYFGDVGDQTPPEEQLKSGSVAMVNFGTFLSGQLNAVDMVSGEDYGFFVIPNASADLDQQSLIFETTPICTAEEAENRDSGLQYQSWWMTEEAQTSWSNARGDVSFNPQALINDEQLNTLGKDATTEGTRLLERYYEATPTPVLTTALDEFSAFVTNPGDPMPHLETIEAEAEAYWSEQE